MILSDLGISLAMLRGEIVINPLHFEQMNPNSYDVTLFSELKVINSNQALDSKKINSDNFSNISIQDDGFELKPGLLYLGSTIEYTESHKHVPQLIGKSTNARNGIKVEMAGLGDVGFCGQWTLEISVMAPIRVYAGMRIAQLVWHEVSGKPLQKYRGRYQNQRGPTIALLEK